MSAVHCCLNIHTVVAALCRIILRVNTSGLVIWARLVACSGNMRNAYIILVAQPKWKRPHEELSIDGRSVLKFILKRQDVRVWNGFIWLTIGSHFPAVLNTVVNLQVP